MWERDDVHTAEIGRRMQHDYVSRIIWTGNNGSGTSGYRAYERTWDIAIPGKAPVHCSNDPLLGGDPTKMNPEDLLLSALSACHMLWYLHFASDAGVVVNAYEDAPVGVGDVSPSGSGRFVSATLKPRIRLQAGMDIDVATAIHHRIHKVCFIAQSVNFPVRCDPTFTLEE